MIISKKNVRSPGLFEVIWDNENESPVAGHAGIQLASIQGGVVHERHVVEGRVLGSGRYVDRFGTLLARGRDGDRRGAWRVLG